MNSLVVVDDLLEMERHLPCDDLKKYKHLEDLNFGNPDSSREEILIGKNAYNVFWTNEQRYGAIGEPIRWRTSLGWTVLGAEFHGNISTNAGVSNK